MRERGYEVFISSQRAKIYRLPEKLSPDMIVRLGKELVVIAVKSRSSLNSSSCSIFTQLASSSRKSWLEFELVMTNPEDAVYLPKAEGSLQEHEIEARLQSGKATCSTTTSRVSYAIFVVFSSGDFENC